MINFDKHPYHNFHGFDPDCVRCQKKQENLFKIEIKITRYNKTVKEVEPFMLSYWKAHKEIWDKRAWGDKKYSILEKHGLGEVNRYFGNGIGNGQHFDWHYNLKRLDRLYRARII